MTIVSSNHAKLKISANSTVTVNNSAVLFEKYFPGFDHLAANFSSPVEAITSMQE